MKAEELMIGDWVRMHYPFDMDIDMRPERIKVLEKRVDIDCEPIPLTAEILEKNGWKYNDMPFYQGWEQYGILLYVGDNGYRINCGTNIALIINSVHELQHALRLCGIDKEIVL